MIKLNPQQAIRHLPWLAALDGAKDAFPRLKPLISGKPCLRSFFY